MSLEGAGVAVVALHLCDSSEMLASSIFLKLSASLAVWLAALVRRCKRGRITYIQVTNGT